MRIVFALIAGVLVAATGMARQNPSPQETPSDNPKQAASKKKEARKEQPSPSPPLTESKPSESTAKPAEPSKPESADADKEKEEHYDVTEVPAVVTHHQLMLNGKALSYTATAGRLPIKRSDGKIEAEMFFVAYTLDGQDARQASADLLVQRRTRLGFGLAAHGRARAEAGRAPAKWFYAGRAVSYRGQSQHTA
jgi:hypothetical protein